MSRPRFVLTPQAQADLIEIWNYIAEDTPENADRVLDRLYDTFRRLAETPGLGHHREDLADARHRFWSVYSYVIAVGGFFPAPDRRSGFRGSRMSFFGTRKNRVESNQTIRSRTL